MDKGLIIMVAVGAAFIYFATGLFNTSSSDDDTQWASDSTKKIYENYYQKDSLGDNVLNLNSLDTTKAKTIWAATPAMEQIVKAVPDFELARAKADNLLADGPFKTYLLNYIDKLKGRYLTGEIDSEKAQMLLKTLQ